MASNMTPSVLILSFLTVIGCAHGFDLCEKDIFGCEFDGFNDRCNVFNNECELECNFYCDESTSLVINTIDTAAPPFAASNFAHSGVGLRVNNVIGFDLIGVSPATPLATTVGIKNKNGIDSDPLSLPTSDPYCYIFVDFTFSTCLAYFGILSYKQHIILVNGWDDYRYHENEMLLLDVSKLTIKYFERLASLAWSTSSIFVQNIMFVLGGATTDCGHTDSIEPIICPSSIPPSSLSNTPPSRIDNLIKVASNFNDTTNVTIGTSATRAATKKVLTLDTERQAANSATAPITHGLIATTGIVRLIASESTPVTLDNDESLDIVLHVNIILILLIFDGMDQYLRDLIVNMHILECILVAEAVVSILSNSHVTHTIFLTLLFLLSTVASITTGIGIDLTGAGPAETTTSILGRGQGGTGAATTTGTEEMATININ